MPTQTLNKFTEITRNEDNTWLVSHHHAKAKIEIPNDAIIGKKKGLTTYTWVTKEPKPSPNCPTCRLKGTCTQQCVVYSNGLLVVTHEHRTN